MPVVFGQIYNYRHEHGERLRLVGLQDVQEVVVLEETHRAVGHLQVDAPDALHDAPEQLGDQRLHLLHFADLEHLLQLGQEQRLLDAVGERPVLQEPFEERNGQRPVFGEEEHGTTQELLVELGAGLDFVQGDDYVLEEDHVLVAEGHGEAGDNTRQDIEQLGSPVELVCFVDETEEALVDCLSDHLAARHQLNAT